MGLFRPKSPVNDTERTWIDESMEWFVGEFGEQALHRPVVLPTTGSFSDVYAGSEEDVRRLVTALCEHMDIDPDRIAIEISPRPDRELREALPLEYRDRSAVGHYQVRDGKALISIAGEQAERLVALVATIAHELCHERLLGEGRITQARQDHEPLTDLLTVHFGLGSSAPTRPLSLSSTLAAVGAGGKRPGRATSRSRCTATPSRATRRCAGRPAQTGRSTSA